MEGITYCGEVIKLAITTYDLIHEKGTSKKGAKNAAAQFAVEELYGTQSMEPCEEESQKKMSVPRPGKFQVFGSNCIGISTVV